MESVGFALARLVLQRLQRSTRAIGSKDNFHNHQLTTLPRALKIHTIASQEPAGRMNARILASVHRPALRLAR